MAGIAALAIGYVLSQFYRSFLAVLTPVLTSELGMTKVDLSFASGAWFAVFALAQFAVGVSLDRFGPRRTASIMVGVFAGSGAFLFSHGDGAVDGHRGDGADRARLRAGTDVAAVHLRARLFAGALRGADVVDDSVRHGRQRDRRRAAGGRGGGVRLAVGDGGARHRHAWRLPLPSLSSCGILQGRKALGRLRRACRATASFSGYACSGLSSR